MNKRTAHARRAHPTPLSPARRTTPGRPPHAQRLQRTLGNVGFARHLHTGTTVGRPGDRFEQEADRVASRVATRGAAPAQLQARGNPRAPAAASGGGRALSSSERSFFEPRLGADLAGVRIHTDAPAARAARALGARAFTAGAHVAFGPGEYQPDTPRGRRLMAHELTHTLQQAAPGAGERVPAVQRDPLDSQPSAAITAADIFPFAEGSRVVLGQILPTRPIDFLGILETLDAETADALRAIHGQVATVTAAGEDVFEAVIAGPVSLPAREGGAARSLRDVTVRLERSGTTFDFTLAAREGDRTTATALFEERGLTASRRPEGIVLSSGSGADATPRLRVAPGADGGVRLAVFREIFIDQVPELARSFVPATIEAIAVRQLPEAATDADAQQAAESMGAAAAGPRLQSVDLAPFTGFQAAAGRFAPLLSASWQIRFPIPHDLVGQFVQIPLEVRLQYAPPTSVLAGLSTGVTAIVPTEIPLNLSLVAGIAGGQVDVPVAGGGVEPRPAFGIPVGAGVGIELDRWRVNLRYEHFFNLLADSPGVNSLFLGGGVAF